MTFVPSNRAARAALGVLILSAACAAYPGRAAAEQPAHTEPPTPGNDPLPTPPVPRQKPSSGWAGLPIFTYSPETQLGLGLFGTHFFRTGQTVGQSRASSISVVGLYTWRKQLITELIPELYWNGDRSHLWSRVDYRRYPNTLWAIGPHSPDSSEEKYSEDRLRWQGRIGQALRGSLFLYGHFELVSMDLDDREPGGLLDRRALPGSQGGFSMALGPGLAWDSRDYSLAPHRGAFYDVVLMSSQPSLGSTYEFTIIVFDLRQYFPIRPGHTFAGNVYIAVQDGQAPFYQLPQLGGDELLRGYFEGRYRDKTLMLAQAEYRFPIVWRIGGTAFGGLGNVSPTFREFGESAPKWSVGAGLRLMLNRDERLNLRADLGIARGAQGFYVGIGEVF
jgi:outer membrane protein assembly factor BamA